MQIYLISLSYCCIFAKSKGLKGTRAEFVRAGSRGGQRFFKVVQPTTKKKGRLTCNVKNWQYQGHGEVIKSQSWELCKCHPRFSYCLKSG